jgi:NitT/TauT family transport system substrate-binding protein
MLVAAALAAAILPPQLARAQDNLKLAVGQRGNWASSVAEVGQRAGIFKKHGLTLDLLYTQGSGETQQAVIAESVDVGIAAGTMGAMSAFAKGAPVRPSRPSRISTARPWPIPPTAPPPTWWSWPSSSNSA